MTAMGRKEIAEAAGASNRFLDRPVKAMDKDSGIGADLAELRNTVEELDPKNGQPETGARSSGSFRSATGSRDISTSTQLADPHLGDPRAPRQRQGRAADGQCRDRHRARGAVEDDAQARADDPHLQGLDKQLEDKANELDATEPAKAKAIRETALFYTRQRTTDLLTQMAVTVQGYLALDLVKKNNVELVKGVDRASTTTVSALRTAVTVAQAMTNQRLVLEQISALNTTTAGNDRFDRRDAAQPNRRDPRAGGSSTIPLETLQRAFQNIYDTMDQIDTFKLKALGNMKQTVETLGNEVEKSKGYIARAEGVNQGKLDGPASPFTPIEANESTDR